MHDPYSALLGWLSHARCPPPWPFSPGPGGHLHTRGASLLGPTRTRAREAAPQTRPGKVLRFLALHHPADVRAKKGRVCNTFSFCPLFFHPVLEGRTNPGGDLILRCV